MGAKIANTPTGGKAGLLTENRHPRGVYKGTREEWLEEAASIMGVWANEAYEALDKKHVKAWRDAGKSVTRYKHKEVAFACSLMSSGMTKTGEAAHCHYKQATGNGKHEIRMSVTLGGKKKQADSARIADILLHEMIHTMTYRHGHRGGFFWICKNVGLEGKMTSTVASPELRERIITDVVKVLGKYPHGGVKLAGRFAPRGQRGVGSRSIKCECQQCGCTIRMTRVWITKALDEQGWVSCPVCQEDMEVHS